MIQISYELREAIGLQYVLDALHGCSPFGQEKIRALRFYEPAERVALEEELYNVERMARCAAALDLETEQLCGLLCQMRDVRGSLRRCGAGACLDHVELFEVKSFLQRLSEVETLFDVMQKTLSLRGIAFHSAAAGLAVLDPGGTGHRGFYIPDGATKRLARLREEKRRLEAQLFQAADEGAREELRMRRTQLCAEEEDEETLVRGTISAALRPLADGMIEDTETLGRLDFTVQRGLFAAKWGCVRPALTTGEVRLAGMFNPALCALLQEKGREFVPVSLTLARGAAVITGANMGGKSVALKTLALAAAMAQAGFLVCAESAALPLFDSIELLLDVRQSMEDGLSGFGAEVVALKGALQSAAEGFALLLLDEFARGTNPDEGAAIVRAVTQYLNGQNAVCVLTTHYDNIAPCAAAHYQVAGLRDADGAAVERALRAEGCDPLAVIARYMNYGLYRVEGQADCPRDALRICRMLAMPQEIMGLIEKDD